MSRTWINTNRNRGNIIKFDAKELEAESQTITPNANLSIYRVLDSLGDIILTIDGSKSLPGDELIVLVEATAETTLSIDGDAAAGSIAIGAGGVGAIKLINGGGNNNPFFLSYAPLS